MYAEWIEQVNRTLTELLRQVEELRRTVEALAQRVDALEQAEARRRAGRRRGGA